MEGEKQLIQKQRFQQVVADDLVLRAQAGEMRAHSEIYRMFSPAVLTLARGFCRNQQAAEDVLHNTFIKLIDKISSFENRAPFGMWLRRIAVNESLTYLRKQKKHSGGVSIDEFAIIESNHDAVEDMSLASDYQDFTEVHGTKHELSDVLRELPEHVRLILWLKEIEGYTHDEIAKMVNKTPSYSKSVVARSYKFLREKIGSQDLVNTVSGC
ncbi:MAG: sigma-70 family RNA polymerase sigma factor [Pseudomonadota bacterium]